RRSADRRGARLRALRIRPPDHPGAGGDRVCALAQPRVPCEHPPGGGLGGRRRRPRRSDRGRGGATEHVGPGGEDLKALVTTTPSPPDGAARPVRVVRAAEEAPGKLRITCSQAEPGEEDYPLTCLAHLGAETLAAASVRVADGGTRRITLARGDCASCPLAQGDVPDQVDRAVSAALDLLERSGAGGQDLFEVVEAAEEEPAGKRRRPRHSGGSRGGLWLGGRAGAEAGTDAAETQA